ncbi:unnamed protein product [Absidia cylindrospora]
MKLNVLYISFAIGLLTQTSQARPILGDVASVSSEGIKSAAVGANVDSEGVDLNGQGSVLDRRQVLGGGVAQTLHDALGSDEGVRAPLAGTGDFAEKITADLVSQPPLEKRQAALGGVDDVTAAVENTIGGLRKRQGNLVGGLTGADGGLVGTVGKTVGGLTQGLRKRQAALGGVTDGVGLSGTLDGVTRTVGELTGGLRKRQAALGGVTDGVGLTGTLDGVTRTVGELTGGLRKRQAALGGVTDGAGLSGALDGVTGAVGELTGGLRKRQAALGGVTDGVGLAGTLDGVTRTVGGLTQGLRKRQGDGGGDANDVVTTLDEALGKPAPELRKRSPLLDNQGDGSVGASGGGLVGSGNDGGAAGLVNGLFHKRQADDDLLSSNTASSTDINNPLGDGSTMQSVVGEAGNGAISELKLSETVGNVENAVGVDGAVSGLVGSKRDGSNDDDGSDLLKPSSPYGAMHGSGMAANAPSAADIADAMTKRGEEEEGDDDESHNGENKQDHVGPPPPYLTAEQLDDYYTKRDEY